MSTVVDIGGGSTEFINGENASINYRKSLNIGAIKITENYFPKHPPTLDQIEKAENFIINNLEQLEISYLGGDLFAVAGTPTTLAAISKGLSEFDYSEIDGVRLSLEFLENIKNDFLSLTIDQIIYKYKIHPKRADVITAGTIILKSVLHFLNRDNFIVSAKGLRYGILKTMLK
jgi:exopolyphosphatase/guanosine-5'-triphosphate,3'-diphosphate pyrophosphatase